jgi:hypothetical protein
MTAATELYEQTSLWSNAFASKNDGLAMPRDILRVAYQAFRERVALLIGQIKTELPNLTLHDITHVDALWRVASEVAGSKYDLNPAEAFVLGGAFLLHDAAHCRAAYKGGLPEIKATNEWRDAAAQRGLANADLQQGTDDFNAVLFDTLRVLHPQQATKLPFSVWGDTPANAMHLLPHDDLRDAYGHAIGEIAKSHWMSPHELEVFANKKLTAPTYLPPAAWTVDWLKIAVLLRVADALHMDAVRAPRFLMQIAPPTDKHSRSHWDFQARMHSIKCDPVREEVVLTSSPFPASEQTAWWLAYDTARMADRELSAAHHLLRDHNLPLLAAREVAGIRSPEMFAKHVPVQGWTPVDTEVRISQVQTLVENFGGKKLYGDNPRLALRELLQNAIDAVHACRALGGLGELEGEIEVALEPAGEGQQWLHVTDTGIGMSRYVLTNVLLDFGRSLWRSSDLRGEWSGLAATGFEAIGQFGIGFFSVFMLGEKVRVTTNRYEVQEGERQWALEFKNGTQQRPLLREPLKSEKLNRHGTRISVLLNDAVLTDMLEPEECTLAELTALLAPAVDVNIYFKSDVDTKRMLIQANDWKIISTPELWLRLLPVKEWKAKSKSNLKIWPQLTNVLNSEGQIMGRLSVWSHVWYAYRAGIGVSNGLYAGDVSGVLGLISCKPQLDLARRSATPDISLIEVSQWAESHRQELVCSKQLTSSSSFFLANFGSNFQGLYLGELGGSSVTYEELISTLQTTNEIILHEGDIDLRDDEHIAKSDHEFFEPSANLLQTSKYYAEYEWIPRLKEVDLSTNSWSIKAAIEKAIFEAWRDDVLWDSTADVVGTLHEHEIIRTCRIARRASSLEV